MGHEQAITGTPCDDPVPKKVSFKISVSLGGSNLQYLLCVCDHVLIVSTSDKLQDQLRKLVKVNRFLMKGIKTCLHEFLRGVGF